MTNPPQTAGRAPTTGTTTSAANLPSGKSGRHIIYSRWVRSDSQENFFGCSDVVFDGGNGQVTGVGTGGSTRPDHHPGAAVHHPAAHEHPAADHHPAARHDHPAAPGGDCMAVYRVVGTWNGGFQGEVTIMNHGSRTYGGWVASWTLPSGQQLNQVWNGAMSDQRVDGERHQRQLQRQHRAGGDDHLRLHRDQHRHRRRRPSRAAVGDDPLPGPRSTPVGVDLRLVRSGDAVPVRARRTPVSGPCSRRPAW